MSSPHPAFGVTTTLPCLGTTALPTAASHPMGSGMYSQSNLIYFPGIILSVLMGIFSRCVALFAPPVKQREAVRATWKRVTPQTRVRGGAPQPWPTAPLSGPSPPRKAHRPLRLRLSGSTRFPYITPNTSRTCRRSLLGPRRWMKNLRS